MIWGIFCVTGRLKKMKLRALSPRGDEPTPRHPRPGRPHPGRDPGGHRAAGGGVEEELIPSLTPELTMATQKRKFGFTFFEWVMLIILFVFVLDEGNPWSLPIGIVWGATAVGMIAKFIVDDWRARKK